MGVIMGVVTAILNNLLMFCFTSGIYGNYAGAVLSFGILGTMIYMILAATALAGYFYGLI